ncbi:MAG: hypothetical protein ACOZAN_00990 [Patescibacteria group bacterium]
MNFVDFYSIELAKLSPKLVPIYDLWAKISQEPNKWFVDAPGKLLFSAGGVLPIVFGDNDSQIWQEVEKVFVSGQENFAMAGVSFTKNELLLLGEFYRFELK